MSYKKQLMKSNVFSSIFLKNVSKLALGTGIAQLITILISPVLIDLIISPELCHDDFNCPIIIDKKIKIINSSNSKFLIVV